MDPFHVLAQRAAEQAQRDLGHSALPDAPVQPVVERHVLWRRLRHDVAGAARRVPAASARLARRGRRVVAVRRRLPLRSPTVTSHEACRG